MNLSNIQTVPNSTTLGTNTNKPLGKLTSELDKFKTDKSPEQLSKCQESLYNYMQTNRYRTIATKQLAKYHWLKSSYSVDDLLQETYLKLSTAKNIERLIDINCIDMYISTSIQNVALDIKRLASNKPTHSIGDLKEIDPAFLSRRERGKLQALDYRDWSVRRRETTEQEERLELINETERTVNLRSNELMKTVVDNSLAYYELVSELRAERNDRTDEERDRSNHAWLDNEVSVVEKENRRLSEAGFNSDKKENNEAAGRLKLLRARRSLFDVLSSKNPLNAALKTIKV